MNTQKSPADQAGLNAKTNALILSLEDKKPRVTTKKFPTSQKPFMRWWEDTLDHHWPYPVPADLTPDKERIWKLAEIGHALRVLEGRNAH